MTRPTDPVRHAGRMEDDRWALCDSDTGRTTRPTESVNCPECRVILNHVAHNVFRMVLEAYASGRRDAFHELRELIGA